MLVMDVLHYQTQTLVEVAYKALKKDITERVLVPGQKIIIREVSERYGISETPIKQALNRLIAEGLVENIPRRGMRVRMMHLDEMTELMDIRFMIETYYIKQVLDNFTKDNQIREKFRRNLEEHRRIIENVANVEDFLKQYYLDQEFHQMFVKCSGNKRIIQIYNSLGTHGYAYYIYGKPDKKGLIEGVKEHEDIYWALVKGDEAEVRRRMEIHIINAKNKVYQMLKDAEKDFLVESSL